MPDSGFAFDPGRVEPGPETVLGMDYGGDRLEPVLAALQDLALRPETARHIAGKLAVHFVSDTPDPALVAAMSAAWTAIGRRSDGGGWRRLLDHPAAWGPEAAKGAPALRFRRRGAARAGAVAATTSWRWPKARSCGMILDPMAEMGQPWQGAAGPDGWPEAAGDWITPQGMAARITWAMEVPGRLVTPLPEAAEVAARALGARGVRAAAMGGRCGGKPARGAGPGAWPRPNSTGGERWTGGIFLRGLGGAACSAAAHPLLTTMTFAEGAGLGDNRLVVVILRGAMDGLDVVQPRGDAGFAGRAPGAGAGRRRWIWTGSSSCMPGCPA